MSDKPETTWTESSEVAMFKPMKFSIMFNKYIADEYQSLGSLKEDDNGRLVFEGDVDESAKVFMQYICDNYRPMVLVPPQVEVQPDPIIGVLKSNLAEGVSPSFSGGDLKHLISLLERAPVQTQADAQPDASEFERLKAENQRLSEALKFYADSDH